MALSGSFLETVVHGKQKNPVSRPNPFAAHTNISPMIDVGPKFVHYDASIGSIAGKTPGAKTHRRRTPNPGYGAEAVEFFRVCAEFWDVSKVFMCLLYEVFL